MIWAIGVIIALSSCGNSGESAVKEDSKQSDEPIEKNNGNTAPATYGTAEMKDTTTLGGHLYTYEMVCQADPEQALLKNSFNESYYENKVVLTIWKGGERVGSKTFVKEQFAQHVSGDMRKQVDEALLTGFMYEPTESDARRMCFRTMVGWGGEGPKFKVYISTDASSATIQYVEEDENTYEAPTAE